MWQLWIQFCNPVIKYKIYGLNDKNEAKKLFSFFFLKQKEPSIHMEFYTQCDGQDR